MLALECLDHLTARFAFIGFPGSFWRRKEGLKMHILFTQLLNKDPTNTLARKRMIAMLRAQQKITEASDSLRHYLNTFTSDFEVRIRVCPESWKALLQLSTEARDEGHLDVYYVFGQLNALGAFAFCATRQMLYPGVPLFDSPLTSQKPPTGTTREGQTHPEMSTGHSRKTTNRMEACLKLLQLDNTSRTALNDALKSLDTSLMRYTEAKYSLNSPSTSNVKVEFRDDSNEASEETEEFLPGLNFITYPGCLNKVFDTLRKLNRVEKEYETTKEEPTDHDLDSSEASAVDDSRGFQMFPDLVLESVPPEDPVTDQVVGICSQFTPTKRRSRRTTSISLSTNDDEVSDIGERRRLLRQPSTWAKELVAQAAAVRAHGHHRSRRRPTQRKSLKRRTDTRSISLIEDTLIVFIAILLSPYSASRSKSAQSTGTKQLRILSHRNSPDGGQDPVTESQPSTATGAREDLIDSRLSQLSDPSNELLTYYRRKVETLTEDHEHVQRRLDKIADAIGNQETLTWEVRQREAEIAELQRALSDMQVYLFQEREHVLRMYAENDRLKIRELNDRRKIQHLLQLSGLGPAEVTYFLRDSCPSTAQKNKPHNAEAGASPEGGLPDTGDDLKSKTECLSGLVVPPVVPPVPVHGVLELTASGKTIRRQATGGSTTCHTHEPDDGRTSTTRHSVSQSEHEAALREIEMLKASLRSLQTQLAEQTRTAREQIDSLLDDRVAMQEEMDTLRKRHEDRIRQSAEQLKRCQDLLYDGTEEFLAQRNQFRQAEKLWIAEKDKLLSQLETRRVALAALPTGAKSNARSNSKILLQSNSSESNHILESKTWAQIADNLSEKRKEQMAQTITSLEHQLDQQQKLSDMYREQVIQLEEELVRCREEGLMSKDVLKQHTGKLNQRLQTVNNRYRELERRRQLEMEGYRTDINTLRKKLREVEKQLLKVSLSHICYSFISVKPKIEIFSCKAIIVITGFQFAQPLTLHRRVTMPPNFGIGNTPLGHPILQQFIL
ncbi:unnamed protein product [Echinostoma caproni]|uniref:DUF5741 domain-containing protein n=1 Tax=Echinostoma caproni TaxID=27848 RepID=A0A183ADC3_9TREM|nr:unnamed protein product [Echinostoma caproni]